MIARLGSIVAVVTASLALVPAAASAATIVPDITDDEYDNSGTGTDTGCSLREAVQSANVDGVGQFELGCTAGTGDDTIQLGAGTYQLTISLAGDPTNINQGDLEVNDTDRLTVTGNGLVSTFIDGGDVLVDDRVFDVSGGNFTLTAATVQNGHPGGSGGGILSTANVTLNNARLFSNSISAGNGGGILVTGAGKSLTLNTGTTIDNNSSVGSGGGIELTAGASLFSLGAGVAVSSNDAAGQGGGINLGTGAGDIDLGGGTAVEDNVAVFAGGGISSTSPDPASDVLLNGVSIINNDVAENFGGLASGGGINYVGAGRLSLTDSLVDFNTATGDEAQGGGISTANSADSFTLTRSVVVNNSVTVEPDADPSSFEGGGGVYLEGAAVARFTDSLIGANSAIVNDTDDNARAGGIRSNGTVDMNRTTVSQNDISGGTPGGAAPTRSGAGLFVEVPTGVTQILNSTFSGNTAGAGGGSTGGAIAASLSLPIIINHTTFAENVAAAGAAFNPFGVGSFTLRNSVIDQGATGCTPPLSGVNGFNVDAGTSCVGMTADTDLENTDPVLGGLVDNGGPLLGGAVMESTRTHELSGPPEVFDSVPLAACDDNSAVDLLVDQRGAPRPTDAGCEPGSYEIVRCLGVPAYVGTAGNDTITASFFVANAFLGLGGNDTINGDVDVNRLCGGSGNDMLSGFTGNDMIDGGSGSDQLLGQADMDSLFARDGEGDLVDCGTEADTAQTDRLSLDSVTGCESVDALAEPPVVTPTPISNPPAPVKKKKCKRKKKGAAAAKKCRKKK